MNKIRFGVIGTNFITDWVIAGAKQDERFELVAVCSRTQERANEFAAKYDIPYTFTSLEEMAASPLIDAVYIATPNYLHASQSILCMKHGKHVLCEKPMASNAYEVKQMIAASRQYGVTLMEAMKPTLTPNFRVLREALPKAGVIRGVYTVYPMVVLFGRPNKISASGVVLSTGTDGQGAVNFEYEGMNATVLYSKIANSSLPTEIEGEDGNFMLDKINQINRVTWQARPVASSGKGPLTPVEDISAVTDKDEYYYEVAEFINLVQAGKLESEVNSHENSLITIEIIDEVRRQLGVSFLADHIRTI